MSKAIKGKNIPLEKTDYIDIFKAKNKDEILEFMSKPIPFCRFCDVLRRKPGYKWETSEKDISEWT